MKKVIKAEGGAIEDLINKMQQQLNFLEKKIDTLIGQSAEKPFRHFDHPHRQNVSRPDTNYRERVLHKAICAECGKECEVPFKPSGGRPVYCKDCFSKRKSVGSFSKRPDNRRDENKKFLGKKRPAVKRRKTRS